MINCMVHVDSNKAWLPYCFVAMGSAAVYRGCDGHIMGASQKVSYN